MYSVILLVPLEEAWVPQLSIFVSIYTGPVQVSFPSWTLHSGWQGIHSPDASANSRVSLHSHRKNLSKCFHRPQMKKISNVGSAGPDEWMDENWPCHKHALWHTSSSSAVLFAGETLIRAWTPAALRGAKGVAHAAHLNCTEMQRDINVIKTVPTGCTRRF